jgi:hypothetical protein
MGVDSAVGRMHADGLGALELAVCYHPITNLTPGARGRRLMYMDDGGVFFPARTQRYGRIKPKLPAEAQILDAWPRAAEEAGRLGMDLNGWLPALYQPWIAESYPDCARVMATGQPIPSGACPGSPDVQDFLVAIAGDVASQFPLRTLQLEGITFPSFDAGWRLQRILVELGPWSRWLLSLCFCSSCVARASARGIAVDALRSRVSEELYAMYERGENKDGRPFEEVHGERLASDEDYAAFISLRQDVEVELLTRIADAIDASAPGVALGIWAPKDYDGMQLDLPRVLPRVGVLQTRQPLIAPDNAREARAIAHERGQRVTAIHWVGGRIGPPFGPAFERALSASVQLGIDQINLFNWAMLAPRVASQIEPMLRRLEAAWAPRLV